MARNHYGSIEDNVLVSHSTTASGGAARSHRRIWSVVALFVVGVVGLQFYTSTSSSQPMLGLSMSKEAPWVMVKNGETTPSQSTTTSVPAAKSENSHGHGRSRSSGGTEDLVPTVAPTTTSPQDASRCHDPTCYNALDRESGT